MNLKHVRIALAVTAAAVVISSAILLTRYFYDPSEPVAEFDPGAGLERVLAEASAASDNRERFPPVYRNVESSESVRSEGAIMLIKNKDFDGVAESPKGMLAMLNEMSGANKRKAAPVPLTEKDMLKKVTVARIGKPEAPLVPSSVPGLGQGSSAAGGGGVIMVTAPVDYQIFRSSASWNAFTASHKGYFPGIDFSKEQMLILVSVSDLPSGIFKIRSVKRSGKEMVVRYWVDPLAMSAENEIKEYDLYSAAAVPRGLDVRLEQVP